MAEWWTYRPSDFLMFSAASHARLLELHNREAWPLHLGMALAAAALLAALARPSPGTTRAATAGLAGVWAWVGWGFLWSRFAEINTVARYLAAAFLLQAAVLGLLALVARVRHGRGRPRAGATLLGAAVLLWPALAPLTGRSWVQAEFFGLAPEPTALATLGWLLGTGLPHRAWAAVIPLVSLVLGIGMLWLLYGPP